MTTPFLTDEEDEINKLLSQQPAGGIPANTPGANVAGIQAAVGGPSGQTAAEMSAITGDIPRPAPEGYAPYGAGAGGGAPGSATTAPSQIPSGTTPGTMPPPVPPTYQNLGEQVNVFASDWMLQGNRFLSPAAQAQLQAGNAQLAQSEIESKGKIDEWAASRGLVGSSYEGEQQVDLQESLQRARGTQQADLLQMFANAETLDREAAGRFGLDAATMEQNIGFRAQELMNEGRALDLQEARDMATRELSQAQLEQQGEQFQATLSQRQEEFAGTIGLSREQFQAQNQQFAQQYTEQIASRLQQNEQFGRALDSDESRFALSLGLQSKALELQQAGLDAETAWREADRLQEREITDRAQALQERGFESDDAHRWAVLEQNVDFHNDQVRLDELGYSQAESFFEAEQNMQLKQLNISQQQVDQRATEIKQGDRSLSLQEARDKAQIGLAREQMDFQIDMQTNEIAQRESEFARSIGMDEKQLVQQQQQFATQMGEQVATRLQNDTQFTKTWQQEDARMAMENGLRNRALELQQQGMEADIAFQQAQQEFEYGHTDEETGEVTPGYKDRVLQLQRAGMDQDEAYRYAALAQDSKFQTEAQRLQELGLTMEESYREAALRLQEGQMLGQLDGQETLSARQFREEMQFRMDTAETAKEQFELMMDMWYAISGKERPGTDTPDINIIGGTGGTGGTGTGGGGIDDYPTIPAPDGGSWRWDSDKQTYVDGSGNEYNE